MSFVLLKKRACLGGYYDIAIGYDFVWQSRGKTTFERRIFVGCRTNSFVTGILLPQDCCIDDFDSKGVILFELVLLKEQFVWGGIVIDETERGTRRTQDELERRWWCARRNRHLAVASERGGMHEETCEEAVLLSFVLLKKNACFRLTL